MQVERGQAWIVAVVPGGREKASAIGERQQVAFLRLRLVAVSNPLGEHAVEQVTAPCGEQSRTQVALFRQTAALGESACVEHIAAVMAEALGAEVVRHAVSSDALQALFEGFAVGLQRSQAQN